MSDAFDSMAGRSQTSAEVARQSEDIAHRGAEKVRETIRGMDTIRDQIGRPPKPVEGDSD